MAELRRIEEEQRIKRERKEAKQRARVEEKTLLQNEIAVLETSRSSLEKEYNDILSKYKSLESQLREQTTQNEYLQNRVKSLSETVFTSAEQSEKLEFKLKDEIYQLKNSLIEEKNNLQKTSQSKFQTEKEILLKEKQMLSLKEELALHKSMIRAKDAELATLNEELSKYIFLLFF